VAAVVGRHSRAHVTNGVTICVVAALSALSVTSVTSVARADEEGELQKGRALYESGQHAEAETFFAKAIDSITPTIVAPTLVTQARMYRGASAMYLGRKADAVAQFELILKTDPTFEPDAIAFPPGVIDEFRKTRERLSKDVEAKAKSDAVAAELAATRDKVAKLQDREERLVAFAATERVVTTRSRVVAAIPFGIGQFQNGDAALGALFLIGEGVALTTATIAYGVHESIPTVVVDPASAQRDEVASRYTNLISAGLFLSLAVIGVVQAETVFVGETVQARSRVLPPSLSSPIARSTWVIPFAAPIVEGHARGATAGLTFVF
jgi:tetratricopeptide (TPR) repeat protein